MPRMGYRINVASVIGDTVESPSVQLPNGVLQSVRVRVEGTTRVPRGRFYASVSLSPPLPTTWPLARRPHDFVWSGYPTERDIPTSFPSIPIQQGQEATLNVRQLGDAEAGASTFPLTPAQASRGIIAELLIDPGDPAKLPVGGSHIVHQLPGTGPSEELSHIAGGDPAAGAQPVALIVPNFEAWKLIGTRVPMNSDALSVPQITIAFRRTAGANRFHSAMAQTMQAAEDYIVVGQIGTAFLANNPQSGPNRMIPMPLPDILLWPGMEINLTANDLNAGDQFGAIEYGIQRWAVPVTG